jgi:hypothetical protein
MTMRHNADQPLTTQRASARAGHVRRCPGLIEKHQLGAVEFGHSLGPCGARFGDVGAVLFGGSQAFF